MVIWLKSITLVKLIYCTSDSKSQNLLISKLCWVSLFTVWSQQQAYVNSQYGSTSSPSNKYQPAGRCFVTKMSNNLFHRYCYTEFCHEQKFMPTAQENEVEHYDRNKARIMNTSICYTKKSHDEDPGF